jgi:hypothetical protein
MKKCTLICIGVLLTATIQTAVLPLSIVNTLRWLKQRLITQPMTRGFAHDGFVVTVPETAEAVSHTSRSITFENNIPEFFDALKGSPDYEDLPNLIDQTIIVNGKSIMPGTSTTMTIDDDQFLVTIKLYKGIAKLIYAMEHGTLRGILMRLLKQLDPWIQWQYNFSCRVNKDLDRMQLSDVVLAAYDQSRDLNAVNHRFKWVLVVELALNKELDL